MEPAAPVILSVKMDLLNILGLESPGVIVPPAVTVPLTMLDPRALEPLNGVPMGLILFFGYSIGF